MTEMNSRAIYLANPSHIDASLLSALQTRCADVHSVPAIAQAAALIDMPLTPADYSTATYLILAEVTAGGLALAEYVSSIQGRAGHRLNKEQAGKRIGIVLIDPDGDVNAARKALRLGVDGYLLSGDALEQKLATIDQVLEQLSNSAPPDIMDDDPNIRASSQVGGSISAFTSMHILRLSQIESAIMSCLSAHIGLPISASNIVSEVMGREMDEDKAASLIRPHISRLRSKVEPTPQMPQRLLTVRGKGYMFVC
jgi:DNA-binding response OmpR family regulator